jgi:proteasome lid subunit RPN8/RPN11
MSKKKHKHKPGGGAARSVTFHGSVLQSIRQHARSSPHAEICGALIGRQSDAGTYVNGAVPGEGAAQGGAHVTFTQEAWVRIHEEKDRQFSGQTIVGWYHSHPGFGVFLSDHDLFIHKNFFSEPGSLAWVYDPHSDEEGCFGWNGGEVRRLERFGVVSDVLQDTFPKSEPVHSMQGHSARPRLQTGRAFWRSSRVIRSLMIAAATILLALLVVLGFHALQRSSLYERLRHGQRPDRVKPPAEKDAEGPSEKAAEPKDAASARGPSTESSGDSVGVDHASDRNGVGDER